MKVVTIPILSLPMIEHVRRRAEISKAFKNIYVASPDKKILNQNYVSNL